MTRLEQLEFVRKQTMPKAYPHGMVDPDHVKRVAVILTSSRSGSTFLKEVLSQHPQIASLPGEEEPHYTLTQNGYPFSSDSDAFYGHVNFSRELACRLLHEMQINESPFHFELASQWRRRFLLQFGYTWDTDAIECACKYVDWLSGFLGPRRAGFYDGAKERTPFAEAEFKLEEPPFVRIKPKRLIRPIELAHFTLLFKTPQDCYRIGLFENLFPYADIKYIHLTRGFAQTVNGLMDGWECDYGFFAHNVGAMGVPLAIQGYSDRYPHYGRRWWKFDLPPNWRDFVSAPLLNVCLNQWVFAHTAILNSSLRCLRVRYEDVTDTHRGRETWHEVCKYLGLEDAPIGDLLTPVMATESPEPYRWRKKRSYIASLGRDPEVAELMHNLDYSLDPETWS